MKHKAQIRWALVGTASGHIYGNMIRFNRKAIIEETIAEHRLFASNAKHADLTDAQFWRIIKRRRGYCVRRISMRVVR